MSCSGLWPVDLIVCTRALDNSSYIIILNGSNCGWCNFSNRFNAFIIAHVLAYSDAGPI